jgi:hypothetical protein
MSVFDKLFGKSRDESPETRFKRVLEELRTADPKMGPLYAVSLTIVTAAWETYQRLAPVLKFSNEEPKPRQAYLLYELVFFFSHVTLRSAVAGGLTDAQIKKLQGYLLPSLSTVAVKTFFGHWSEDLKNRIRSEFCDNLNAAEVDYAPCRDLLSKEPLESDTLFGRLGLRAAAAWGEPLNPVVMVAVKTSAIPVFLHAYPDTLMNNVGASIDALSPDEFEGMAALSSRW